MVGNVLNTGIITPQPFYFYEDLLGFIVFYVSFTNHWHSLKETGYHNEFHCAIIYCNYFKI